MYLIKPWAPIPKFKDNIVTPPEASLAYKYHEIFFVT